MMLLVGAILLYLLAKGCPGCGASSGELLASPEPVADPVTEEPILGLPVEEGSLVLGGGPY